MSRFLGIRKQVTPTCICENFGKNSKTGGAPVSQLVDVEGWLPKHVALLTTQGRHPVHAK